MGTSVARAPVPVSEDMRRHPDREATRTPIACFPSLDHETAIALPPCVGFDAYPVKEFELISLLSGYQTDPSIETIAGTASLCLGR